MDIKVVFCDYCKRMARLTTGAEIYPHRADLKDAKFWKCDPCNAHVGCHRPHPKFNPDGTNPLGRLANPALRRLRWKAHAAFDPLWKSPNGMARANAYRWLAQKMGVPEKGQVHIGYMDEEGCRKVLEIMAEHKKGDSNASSTPKV